MRLAVLDQPGGVAWNIYDERLHRLATQFEDYRQAEAANAIRHADNDRSTGRDPETAGRRRWPDAGGVQQLCCG